MSKIKFYIDCKTTVWQREEHEVEFTSEEDLKKALAEIMARGGNSESIDNELNSFRENDIMYDTTEYLEPSENNNEATIEIRFGSKYEKVSLTNKPE